MKGSYLSLFPEAAGDILPRIIMSILVEPLVSGGAVEGTEVLKVRTNLDIIKIVFIYLRRHSHPAAVPRNLQFRIFLMDVLSHPVDAARFSIPTHKGDAGDVLTVHV